MSSDRERFDGDCPQCGEQVTDAHVRGTNVVLVPCGHTIPSLSALQVPPDEFEN